MKIVISWTEGCFVSAVDLNEDTIVKFVREQEVHDMAMEKNIEKESKDHFSGQ